MFSYCLALAAVIFVCHGATSITECPRGNLPVEVQIDNCTEPPCYVNCNGDIHMTMKFTTPLYLETVTPYVYVFNSVMDVNFTLTTNETNGCNGVLNTFCPLMPQEYIEYKYTAHLLSFPLIPLTLSFNILSGEEVAVCFNANIVPVVMFG
ncbi:uncharacterized protein LOC109601990 [Aethina tumida]|uniref:uncharacterized protein LOC109601990 n=1 Tax=Aethina tumida TaxID=116153 RepID=UPI00096B3167|nr:uncharacterized protein LOC109601990 [Aethina tumida]